MSDATDDLDLAPYRVGGVIDRTDYFWTTRDGKKLNIMDMETSHIQNCIAMLKKGIIDTWAVHGDEPKYGSGGYMDSVMQEHNEKLEASIERFEKELKRRGVS